MKYYLIAGEASGDLHGANLMTEIYKKDPNAEFRFWGGDKMAKVGGKEVKHIKDLAFMGFSEVIMNLKTILKNIRYCKEDIKQWKPDAVIFIDYPGFNLRIAEFVHALNIKSYYYISPQLWAWKAGRVDKIKQFVDKMFVILPFEKEWYKNKGMEVDFVGHPLLDELEKESQFDKDKFKKDYQLSEKPIIALLPGSRKQEITKKLPIMLSVVEDFLDYQFVVAGAPAIDKNFYRQFSKDIQVIDNNTYRLLKSSEAALVTSGTATLETALLNVPQVVCYKGSRISYEIGKRIVKHIKYIALVNLIMDKEVVNELIQDDLTKKNIIIALKYILDKKQIEIIKEDYKQLRAKLGGAGASQKTAELIIEDLRRN